MIYCVVPEALAEELFDKLSAYYAGDTNVTVIVDRRKGSRRRHGAGPVESSEADNNGRGGELRSIRDRRRPRIVGELPDLPPAA